MCCRIDGISAYEWRGALRGVVQLTHLDLGHNWHEDGGTGLLAEDAITALTQLAHFSIADNSIGAVGAASLAQVFTALVGLSHLNVSYNSRKGAQGADAVVRGLTALVRLTVLKSGLL